MKELMAYLAARAISHISDFMRNILYWLQQRILYRLSSIVWRCVLGIAPTYLLDLFTITSACSGRQSLCSASRGDFVVPHARMAIKQHRAFSIVGLLGTVSHLNSALFHGICPVRFTSSLKPLFLPGLGWERLLVFTLKWCYINFIDR